MRPAKQHPTATSTHTSSTSESDAAIALKSTTTLNTSVIPQRLITVFTQVVDAALNLVGAIPQVEQGVAHKLNAALKLGAHYVIGTRRYQIRHLIRRFGAGDDTEARRPPSSRLTRNNLGRRRTTPGNHQHPRPLKMRVLQK